MGSLLKLIGFVAVVAVIIWVLIEVGILHF
jgi:hypothetical protein